MTSKQRIAKGRRLIKILDKFKPFLLKMVTEGPVADNHVDVEGDYYDDYYFIEFCLRVFAEHNSGLYKKEKL